MPAVEYNVGRTHTILRKMCLGIKTLCLFTVLMTKWPILYIIVLTANIQRIFIFGWLDVGKKLLNWLKNDPSPHDTTQKPLTMTMKGFTHLHPRTKHIVEALGFSFSVTYLYAWCQILDTALLCWPIHLISA